MVAGGECVDAVLRERELTFGPHYQRERGARGEVADRRGRGSALVGRSGLRVGGGGNTGARERGKGMGRNRPSLEGESFSFFFFSILFLFLNSFSPLYKFSFIFPRFQNEMLCVKCY
jgi:hypothetical protein